MQLRSLPSYTTERYYLLSEIEDRSLFEPVENEEGITIVKSRPTTPPDAPTANNTSNKYQLNPSNKHDAIYLLWDLRNDSNMPPDMFKLNALPDDLLKQNVLKVSSKVKELPIILQRSLCCIEIVISHKNDWLALGLNQRVFDMVNWLKKNYNFGCIYVGISDSVGGAPALEAILDYSKIIEDHNLQSALLLSDLVMLRVVSVNMVALLGLDPTREPDAVNGVYQAEMVFVNNTDDVKIMDDNDNVTGSNTTNNNDICSDSRSKGSSSDGNDSSCCSLQENSDISTWAQSIGLEHAKVTRDINGQRGDLVKNMKGSGASNIVSLIIFIFVCLAAYLYQLDRNK